MFRRRPQHPVHPFRRLRLHWEMLRLLAVGCHSPAEHHLVVATLRHRVQDRPVPPIPSAHHHLQVGTTIPTDHPAAAINHRAAPIPADLPSAAVNHLEANKAPLAVRHPATHLLREARPARLSPKRRIPLPAGRMAARPMAAMPVLRLSPAQAFPLPWCKRPRCNNPGPSL